MRNFSKKRKTLSPLFHRKPWFMAWGRSSDLFLVMQPSRFITVAVVQNLWFSSPKTYSSGNCPWFSQDSLLIRKSETKCKAKIGIFFSRYIEFKIPLSFDNFACLRHCGLEPQSYKLLTKGLAFCEWWYLKASGLFNQDLMYQLVNALRIWLLEFNWNYNE